MSMPVITLSSSSKTTISSHPPEIIKNNRDPSFSSFLDGAEERFVLKLGAANTIGKKNKTEDREIDVFDAQKYFNEGLNHIPQLTTTKNNSPIQHSKKDDPIEIFATKDQKPIAALSIRSESSWNSRSSLLHTTINPRNNNHHHQPRKGNNNIKSFLATIACNCSCADKYSVDIDDDKSSKSTTRSRQGDKTTIDHNLIRKSQSDYTCVRFDEAELRVNSEGHFSFPVFSKNRAQRTELREEKEDEFFSSAIKNSGNNCLSLKEKLTIMNWDAAISPQTLSSEDINIKIPSISSEMHNDSDSDASSDLFEIESFSKGNRYAPSEASVEWSVVTASAADFSVLSDSEEARPKRVGPNPKTGLKARPGILSGCKSQKAVGIVGDAHRANEQGISSSRRHLVGESFGPVMRFHDEIKVEARSRRQSLDLRALNQSRSHIL